MAVTYRLAEPPRVVPRSLVLKLIQTSGLTKSLIGFIPAALVFANAAHARDPLTRIALIGLAAILLLLGLVQVAVSLARAARSLRRMRDGFLAEGRIEAAGELIWRAEYLVGGECRVGEGHVRRSTRIDKTGMEPLLYDPDRPARVTFLAGLPSEARVDRRGQWEPVDASRRPAALIFTGVIAGLCLLEFASFVPWLLETLNDPGSCILHCDVIPDR